MLTPIDNETQAKADSLYAALPENIRMSLKETIIKSIPIDDISKQPQPQQPQNINPMSPYNSGCVYYRHEGTANWLSKPAVDLANYQPDQTNGSVIIVSTFLEVTNVIAALMKTAYSAVTDMTPIVATGSNIQTSSTNNTSNDWGVKYKTWLAQYYNREVQMWMNIRAANNTDWSKISVFPVTLKEDGTMPVLGANVATTTNQDLTVVNYSLQAECNRMKGLAIYIAPSTTGLFNFQFGTKTT